MDLYSPSITPAQLTAALTITTITASETYTVPISGSYLITAYGGGGGGGAGAGVTDLVNVGGYGGYGGQAGFMNQYRTNLNAGDTYTVTIGTGGVGGAAVVSQTLSPGSDGVDTSFGAIVTGYGGKGGYGSSLNTADSAASLSGLPGQGIANGVGGQALVVSGSGAAGAAATATYGGGGGGGGGALGDSTTAYDGGAGGNGAPGRVTLLYLDPIN